MRYNKKRTVIIGFGTIGRNAYKVSKVWKLGIHFFKTEHFITFRIVFFRSKYKTYYWDFSKIRPCYDSAG